MERNERTLQMMQNYVRLHAEGLSPSEIAKRYNLSTRNVYYVLQEIADKAGVSRESLLKAPHSEHQPYERISEPVKPVDTKAFSERFQNALAVMNEFKELVQMAIDGAEHYEETMEGRFDNGNYDDEG
jgi:DNA-binding CsgD family transcriptional regulator